MKFIDTISAIRLFKYSSSLQPLSAFNQSLVFWRTLMVMKTCLCMSVCKQKIEKEMADVLCRMVLHIAIFGYMQYGNLMHPKPNTNCKSRT